ncbi:MAG: hypothetical protein ABR961_07905 [Thermoanaerobaculaceae bacterium]|jgi:hypothetical protein
MLAPLMAFAGIAASPLALRVDIERLGKGSQGTVVGVAIQVAPDGRKRAGERLRVWVSFVQAGRVIVGRAPSVSYGREGAEMRRLAALVMATAVGVAVFGGCVVRLAVPGPPPGPIVELRGVAPGPAFVWIDGYWAWHSRWVWMAGSWVVPPRAHAVWVPGRWYRHTSGWRWAPGFWR